MTSRKKVSDAVRRALSIGSIGALSTVSFAVFAQQASGELEEIVITGSRIVAPNQVSTSPIVAVTAQEIKVGGKTDVSDLLNTLPQNFNNAIGQDLGNSTSGLTSAGGVSTADLRGLGPNRTLVLIDGRRLGQGSPNTKIASPAPDLDQIPIQLVERVDVVTGGASSVYGADAIAGVVNFIMKKNFEGVQFDVQMGENWHSQHNDIAQAYQEAKGYPVNKTTAYDGRNQSWSFIAGTNFADNKGNITGYMGYQNQDPVASADRDFGGCQLNEVTDAQGNVHGVTCSGSSNSNLYNPSRPAPGAGTTYSVQDGTFIKRASTNDTSPPYVFNSQPFIYMQRGDDRYTGGFFAHDDVTDSFKPYAEFMFMDDKTHQAIAPSGLFQSSNPITPTGNYLINCSNPLLSKQEAAILCSPSQIAADAANPGSVSADVNIGRRNIEGGPRTSDFEHTNYRAVLGSKGDIAKGWTYDVYAQYYYVSYFESEGGYLNLGNITNALQVTGTADNPVCIVGSPCVPWNIFRNGGIAATPSQGVTAGALSYLTTPGTASGNVTQRTIHGDIAGDLGFASPWAKDDLAVDFGLEYRQDNVVFQPDAAQSSGLLSGFGAAAVPIHNTVSVQEQFLEARVPIMQDRSWVKDLVFGTGIRRSDYSVSGGINTYKYELQWAPIDMLRFRGSFNHAIRAPSIIELYNPQNTGQIQIGGDPCAPTFDPAGNVIPAARSLTECQRTGVTAAQYGNGGTTNTIPQGTSGQLTQLQGGNPNLQPETADTYTWGVTFNPMQNLTGSIDYYRILLHDLVGALPAPVILNDCLNTGNPAYCSQIVRQPLTGGLTGATVSGGGYIVQTNVNIGAGEVDGIDLQLAYKLDLSKWGSLGFAMNGAYLIHAYSQPYVGAHTYDCQGLFGPTCQTVNPAWRHTFRTTWQTPWDVSVALTWRYIDGVKLDNNTNDPTLHYSATWINGTSGYDYYNPKIPSYSWLDLAATWDIQKNLQLRAGINNILDKDPPLLSVSLVPGGGANTLGGVYDQLGRQLFVALTAKF